VIAGKAVAFREALTPEFKKYAAQIISNAQALARSLQSLGYNLVSGGTDTHLILVDLSDTGVSGKKAEKRLEEAGITINKNMVPFDERSPMITSGIRIGTPALTTRGMGEDEMQTIASLIDQVMRDIDNEAVIKKVKWEVSELCQNFPLYETLRL